MHAVTINDLYYWLEAEHAADAHRGELLSEEDRYYEEMGAFFEQEERRLTAGMTAQQRLDYAVFNGELGHCPNCGTRYAEIDSWSFPDMVGETSGETYECCGHTESANSALEYRNGYAVDVS